MVKKKKYLTSLEKLCCPLNYQKRKITNIQQQGNSYLNLNILLILLETKYALNEMRSLKIQLPLEQAGVRDSDIGKKTPF